MFCRNCGNEIKENENYCGKCGFKVEDDTFNNTSSNTIYNKEPIKIKFSHFLIGIIIILFIFSIIVLMINKQQNNLSEVESIKDTINITSTNNTTNNKVLDVIDKENEEFKINGMELLTALVNSAGQRAKEDNEELLLEFDYKRLDNDKNDNMISYIIGSTFQLQGQGVFPAFEIGVNETTENVMYIAISYPYEGNSGREYSNTAIAFNYRLLKIALTNINQTELFDTIYTIEKNAENEELQKQYFENGLKGIYFGFTDGYERSNGTISGEYCTFKVVPNY